MTSSLRTPASLPAANKLAFFFALAALAAPAGALAARSGHVQAAIAGRLAQIVAADARQDARQLRMELQNGEATFDVRGRLRVELVLRPGVLPSAIDAGRLRAHDAELAAAGIDVVDVHVAIARLPGLVAAFDAELLGARMPSRPTLLGAGKSVSEGADLVAPPEHRACNGNDGKGAKVLVLDSGFEHWKKSIETGELPGAEGTIVEGGGAHGTMCAQVVADVAPGAKVVPRSVNSYAVFQQLVQKIEAGNTDAIDIVTHSVIWVGQSFGRHQGPICKLTDRVRKAGVAWVNASGNSGGGGFWSAVWTDKNNDGKQDIPKPGTKVIGQTLRFFQHGGEIKLVLDWDDYEERTTDLDLQLYRETDSGLELVSESKQTHSILVATVEQVVVPNAKAGTYAAVIVGKKVKPGLKLRIVHLGGGGDSFSVWNASGNVYDPASCDGVLSVGAVPWNQWKTGELAGYSSHGPTVDGRLKPEVVAPTHVATSLGAFGGTSAACPHAAGALALAVAVTDTAPAALVDALIAAADPIAKALPHPASGFGRVRLDAALSGWRCDAGQKDVACESACGSVGKGTCGAKCSVEVCEPPVEACNGADDDCDGATDEGCGGDDGEVDAGGADDATSADGGADAGHVPPGDAQGDGQGDGTTADAGPGATGDGLVASDGIDAKGEPAKPAPSDDGGCSAAPSGAGRSAGGLVLLLASAALWLLSRRRQRT